MRDFKLYFSIATALLIVYLIAQYNKPAPINWKTSLYLNDKIPFGTYVFYRQLNQFFPQSKITRTNQAIVDQFRSVSDSDTTSNYLIVAQAIRLNKYDYKQLEKYLKAGNTVFMTALDWDGKFADTLKLSTGEENKQSHVGLNFTNKQLKQPKDYKFDQDITSEYFESFDTARAVVLGKNELGHATFLRYKFGKGELYLCADPLIFTNYGLLSSRGADYAEKAFSYLPVRSRVYWDQFQNHDIIEDMSPMRVFFSHEGLKWAYYISLFSLLIFVFYEMKRRQRIIPVIDPLKNSTVEFVNVVGQVYYEQRNNQNIAHKKITFFLEYLRTQFYLKTNVLDMEFISRLSQKTGIDSSFATELINHINYINAQPRVGDHELITLNQLIEKFYTQSK